MTIERLDQEVGLPLDIPAITSKEPEALARYLSELVLDLEREKLFDIHQRINLLIDLAAGGGIIYLGTKDSTGDYPNGTWRINGSSSTEYLIQLKESGTWVTKFAVDDDGGITIVTLITTGGRVSATKRITQADSPYTLLATDHYLYCDTDDGAIEVDLPAGVDGTEYVIKNVGSSGNDVTLDPNGTEQIEGEGDALVRDDWSFQLQFETTEQWRLT